jgi:hypothetical protein
VGPSHATVHANEDIQNQVAKSASLILAEIVHTRQSMVTRSFDFQAGGRFHSYNDNALLWADDGPIFTRPWNFSKLTKQKITREDGSRMLMDL